MSKKLKNYIDDHRKEFDDELPSGMAWQHIEQALATAKSAKRFSIRDIYKWSAAAAVFFIMAACFYFLVVRKGNGDPAMAKTNTPAANSTGTGNGTDIGKMAPEYAAEAKEIFQAIETQQQQLKVIAKDQPELYSQFSGDLAALDSSYRVLKAKAVQTPNREVIIRAMLQNLQLQAELLSKQLGILNEINHIKTEKNEKNNLPRT